MRLTSATFVITVVTVSSLSRTTHAVGHLRSSVIEDDSDHHAERRLHQGKAILQMKEFHEGRLLQDNGSDTLIDSQERKKQATLTKYEKMNEISGDPVPAYALHIKSAEESTIVEAVAEPMDGSIDDDPFDESQPETASPNDRFGISIVGGDPSDTNEFPYYVDLSGCGAALVGPDIVLGAAHCGDAIGKFVTIGGGSLWAEIVDQRFHPNWNADTMQNDFTLYKLGSPVTTAGAQVVLNTDGALPWDGQELTIMGYGLTSENGFASSIMLDVVIDKVSDADCQSSYGSLLDPSVMFCASRAGKDTCQGDSGGPIVIRNGDIHTLVGVVSWGIGCARPEYPGIYAKASAVTSWISTVACNEWGSSVNGLCGGSASPPPPPPTTPTPGACTTLTVELTTDSWPYETSILLTTGDTTIWNDNNFEANTTYGGTECIPDDTCSVLEVSDAYGDGLLGIVGNIRVTYGSEIMYDGWDFGEGFFVYMGSGC